MICAGFPYLPARPRRSVEVLLRTPAATAATRRGCGKGPEFSLPDRAHPRSILPGAGSRMTDVAYLCNNCGSVHRVESIRENLILDLRTAASYELSGHRGMRDTRTRFLRWRMSWALVQALWPRYSPHPRLAGRRRAQGQPAESTSGAVDRTAPRSTAHKPVEQQAEVDHGDPHRRVAAAVGQHDAVAVDHRATGVDDVRNVTVAFRVVGD